MACVCTGVPFLRSASLPYAHLQAPESYVILFWNNLNGALLNQQELVVPEPGMQFGIDETYYPSLIRRRLEELPSVALVDDTDDCFPLSDSDSSCCL